LIKKTGRQNGSTLKVAYLFEYVLPAKAFIHGLFVNFCDFGTQLAINLTKRTTPA